MKRKLILLLLVLLSLGSYSVWGQTYYEFAYKDRAGQQCYGFMIYEDDDNCTMRVIEVAANQDITGAEDIKYIGEQSSADGQIFTAFRPEQPRANAPFIVFFWNKLKDSKDVELIPAISFDLDQGDFQDPDSFAEVGLADITSEYLQQFYSAEESVYQRLMTAKKEVLGQRAEISKNLGDGSDIYSTVMAYLSGKGNSDAQGEVTGDDESEGDADNTGSLGNEEDEDDDENPSGERVDYTAGNSPSPNSSGVTLHLVSVINTNVSDIGSSCARDYENISSEFKGISQALGMRLKTYNIMGNNYSRSAVESTIDRLRPASNDVVVFLYSGHGFRFDDQQSKYPAIDLTRSSYDNLTDGNYLLMSDIYDAICAKDARLNLVLSDCCNTPIGVETPPTREAGTLYCRASNNFSLSRLGQLFLHERGSMLSTAASPGETSICDMMGGYFTLAFIRSLRKEINATNDQAVSWNTIINNTISTARQRSSEAGNQQHGLKQITIGGDE